MDKIELDRINNAGHSVSMNRVDGTLALSRAFGDLEFKDKDDLPASKQAVTSFPDIKEIKRNKDDMYIFIACDGIWDCINNQNCLNSLNKKI